MRRYDAGMINNVLIHGVQKGTPLCATWPPLR